jgi:hypothetical protein
MFSKQEYKQALLGCFEIMIFMSQGVARFSTTKRDGLRSFIWPAIFIPIALFCFSFHSTGYSLPLLLTLHGARMILTFAITFVLVYYLSKYYERDQYFWQFVSATNWLNIPIFVLLLPIVFSLVSITGEVETAAHYDALAGTFRSYAIFITMLSYVYTAFVMTYALKLPWELAGAVTIVCLGIDQTVMDATIMLRDYFSAV